MEGLGLFVKHGLLRNFLTASFRPRVLYPQINHEIVAPTDYAEWEELIYPLVKHCNQDRKYRPAPHGVAVGSWASGEDTAVSLGLPIFSEVATLKILKSEYSC